MKSEYPEAPIVPKAYRDYECAVFLKTREQYGELSNFSQHHVTVVSNSMTFLFLTSEALYQACKFPNTPEAQSDILREPNPYLAKAAVKPYESEIREDWHDIKVEVMLWVLRLKLAQNPQSIGKVLLSTSSPQINIVEASKNDDFWGAIRQKEDKRVLIGKNVLGRLWDYVRDYHVHTYDGTMVVEKTVITPEIPNFNLFGGPVWSQYTKPEACDEFFPSSGWREKRT